MNNLKLLKFGTGPIAMSWPTAGKRTGWVAVGNPALSKQIRGDMIVVQECSSFEEVKRVVDQLRADLDVILLEARAHFDT